MAAEQTSSTDGRRRNAAALAFMFLSVVAFSLTPLAIAVGNAASSPFLFSAAMRLGNALAYSAFLATTFRHVLLRRDVLAIVVRRVATWSMLFTLVQQFEYVLFGSATRFIDVTAVVMLFEMYTILMVFLTSALFKRYQPITMDVTLMLLVGLLGFGFIAAGEVGGFLNLGNLRLSSAFIGISLAILGALVAALIAFGLRWGVDLSRALPDGAVGGRGRFLVEICCVLTGQTIGNVVGAGVQGVLGLALGESIALASLGIALACGVLANGAGTIAWRAANLMTVNLGINALSYTTPAVSLIWLYFFWEVDVARFDYLVMGGVSIVAINLLINFEAEIRFGFKALILALWSCGTFVYLRDDLLESLPFDSWLWPGEPLLGVLGLSATVFTLLLSFRVARLAARTQAEDDAIFVLFQKLDLLIRRGIVDAGVREHILAIDAAHSPEELRGAYSQARGHVSDAVAANPKLDDQMRLSEVEAQLNTVVHSRRHGIEFGELFALIIFGGITVLLALLARPINVSGWAGFMFEAFAFSFSAVIIFLVVDVWDLHRDRTSHILVKEPDAEGYGVVFRDARNRSFEQGASIVIGMAIAATYTVLLWYKWIPATSL